MRLEEFPVTFVRKHPDTVQSILTNGLRSAAHPSPVLGNSIGVKSATYDWLRQSESLLPIYGGLYIPTFKAPAFLRQRSIDTLTVFDEDNAKREFSFAPKSIIYGYVGDLKEQDSYENRHLQTFVKDTLRLYNLLHIGQKDFKDDAFYTLFVK